MSSSYPRYFTNHLEPIAINEHNLKNVRSTLQAAIASAVTQIQDVRSRPVSKTDDSLYTGDSGIAFMYLRLAAQTHALGLPPHLEARLPDLVQSYLPNLRIHKLRPAHLAPLDSSVGPALLEILWQLLCPSSRNDASWDIAISTFGQAIDVAVEDDRVGGDEVLYGRAGLLWGMLSVKIWAAAARARDEARQQALFAITRESILEKMVSKIIEAGETGALAYKNERGEVGLPLMWVWHDRYYLGAIHGVGMVLHLCSKDIYEYSRPAGILTVLLQAPMVIIAPYLSLITDAITSLASLTLEYGGHLPSSLPAKHRAHGPLVQICHGSPGLLLLFATFRARYARDWKPEWNEAEELASRVVWTEGLVQKGLGVCHGVAGNAWPWILLSRIQPDSSKSQLCLSRALAFLLHATQLPPIIRFRSDASAFASPPARQYRIPDHPYSLFEGLAGAVCAWADACAVITERLTTSLEETSAAPVLGIPGLGGLGPQAWL